MSEPEKYDAVETTLDEMIEGANFEQGQPISIFNHPPFSQMSLREFGELERSFP